MSITVIPALPVRSATAAAFDAGVEATFNSMPTFINELNAIGALYALSVNTISTTNVVMSTGTKTFNIQLNLGYAIGMTIRIANTALIYMTGDVISYVPSTGVLSVNITAIVGTGTYASWTLSQAAVGASSATNISSTATGNVASTTVQAAIAELDSEKAGLELNNTFSGINTFSAITATGINATPIGATIASSIVATTITANSATVAGLVIRGRTITAAVALSTTAKEIFASIPSWARNIEVRFRGLSSTGTSPVIFQLGTSSAYVVTGYVGSAQHISSAAISSAVGSVKGFEITNSNVAASLYTGVATLSSDDGLTWTWDEKCFYEGFAGMGEGYVTLGAALTRIRVTTNGGVDTFDAGTAYITFEG